MALNLLYKHEWPINDKLSIVVPTVGDILKDEDAYYGLVGSLTASPLDMMVTLDDAGIDFTKLNDYDLFIILFNGLRSLDTSLIFNDIDLNKFKLKKSDKNDQIILVDEENGIIIDRAIYNKIATSLRTIHGLKKNVRKVNDEETKKYLLERERLKQQRRKNRKATQMSQLEPLIVAMVNTEQYKYDYEGTLGLTIYQFNESVRQIIKKVDYDNRMHGIYSGTISAKDISKDELNWLVH